MLLPQTILASLLSTVPPRPLISLGRLRWRDGYLFDCWLLRRTNPPWWPFAEQRCRAGNGEHRFRQMAGPDESTDHRALVESQSGGKQVSLRRWGLVVVIEPE